MKRSDQFLSILVCLSLFFAPLMLEACSKPTAATTHTAETAAQAQSGQATPQQAQEAQQAAATTQANPTPDELYQLVAPIALFPDNLVALVLAASTYPDQVTAANTWLSQNSGLKADALSQAVDKQSWDNSVKGLTQFPDVLTQLATNLSWTSALGDAYYNVPKDVMNAVQVMRQRAQAAGNLKSTDQQKVSVEATPPAAAPAAAAAPAPIIVQAPPQTIIIQPAQPTVVYVPTYNPTVVYGAPVPVYPGYSTGAMVATGVIAFGLGIAVGAAIANNNHCCGWGYNSWGCGWHSSTVVYNRNVYVSHSTTVVNRNNYYNNASHYNNVNRNNVNRNNVNTNNVNRNNVNANNRTNNFTTPTFNQSRNQPQFANSTANPNRGNAAQNNRQQPANMNQQNRGNANQAQNRNQTQNRPNNQQHDAARGYGQQPSKGANSSAFGSYSPGGNAKTNSARGAQSLSGNHGGGGASARPARSSGGGRHR
jgi:hypothetical protein